MFTPFVIAVYESLNYLQCEMMDFKIVQSLLERVQICRRHQEHQAVELLGTNEELVNNYHKTEQHVLT